VHPQSRKKKRKARKTNEARYHAYLLSDTWSRKREEAFAHYGRLCYLCNAAWNLHVHHKTYKRLGHELMEDLMVLCKTCHGLVHSNSKEDKSRLMAMLKGRKIPT